jgi:hypothetical protein
MKRATAFPGRSRASGHTGRRLCAVILASGVLVARGAQSQAISDTVPSERIVSEQEQVTADMQKSRLRLGPVRILPSFSVPQSGYNSNIFGSVENPVGGWLVSVSAGARFLVPFGSKMYLRVNAFPQYTWYPTIPERDSFGGTYDASLLGFFNHAFLELKGLATESYQIYSSELPGLALTKTRGGSGNVEIRVSSRVSALAGGFVERVEYTQPGAPPGEQFDVRLNNRTDSTVRGGLRYHFSDHWNLGAVVEEAWGDFQLVPETRNNRSTAYLGTMGFDSPRFYVNLTGGYREGRPTGNSSFPAYATPVGSFFVSYFPIRWLEIQGYGHRSIVYSVTSPLDPYYFENRAGGGLNIQVVPRVLLRGFAQDGPNNYPAPVGGGPASRVTLLQYGGGVSVQVAGKAVLSGIVTRNVYGPTAQVGNRSYNTYIANLSFSGEFQR